MADKLFLDTIMTSPNKTANPVRTIIGSLLLDKIFDSIDFFKIHNVKANARLNHAFF